MQCCSRLRLAAHVGAVLVEDIYRQRVHLLMESIGEVEFYIVYELQTIVHGTVALVLIDRIARRQQGERGRE
jgi:hypothetical protein